MLKNQHLRADIPTSIVQILVLVLLSMHTGVNGFAAEVYKWVDENGVVTYSQQKPNHTGSSALKTTGAPPSAVQAQIKSRSEQSASKVELSTEQQQNLADLELEEADRIVEEKARKTSNCTLFTRLLAQLTAKDRVRAREPDGSERMVPEEERQERITAAKQEIELNCS